MHSKGIKSQQIRNAVYFAGVSRSFIGRLQLDIEFAHVHNNVTSDEESANGPRGTPAEKELGSNDHY